MCLCKVKTLMEAYRLEPKAGEFRLVNAGINCTIVPSPVSAGKGFPRQMIPPSYLESFMSDYACVLIESYRLGGERLTSYLMDRLTVFRETTNRYTLPLLEDKQSQQFKMVFGKCYDRSSHKFVGPGQCANHKGNGISHETGSKLRALFNEASKHHGDKREGMRSLLENIVKKAKTPAQEDAANEYVVGYLAGGENIGGAGLKNGQRKAFDLLIERSTIDDLGASHSHDAKANRSGRYSHKTETRHSQLESWSVRTGEGKDTLAYQIVVKGDNEPALYIIPGVPSSTSVDLEKAVSLSDVKNIADHFGQPILLTKIDKSAAKGKNLSTMQQAQLALIHNPAAREKVEAAQKQMQKEHEAMTKKMNQAVEKSGDELLERYPHLIDPLLKKHHSNGKAEGRAEGVASHRQKTVDKLLKAGLFKTRAEAEKFLDS